MFNSLSVSLFACFALHHNLISVTVLTVCCLKCHCNAMLSLYLTDSDRQSVSVYTITSAEPTVAIKWYTSLKSSGTSATLEAKSGTTYQVKAFDNSSESYYRGRHRLQIYNSHKQMRLERMPVSLWVYQSGWKELIMYLSVMKLYMTEVTPIDPSQCIKHQAVSWNECPWEMKRKIIINPVPLNFSQC